MITTKPDVAEDGIYNVTQTARAVRLDRHTIAKYAAEGRIKFRRRKADNRLVTTGAEILRLWRAQY